MSFSRVFLKDWSYRKAGSQQWSSSIKGRRTQIHADLLSNKQLPDPFLDVNENLVQWVGETDWEYETLFLVEAPERKHHELVFEGLDTFATVYLNDKELLATDNMFREYVVDVSGKVHNKGPNKLRIVFSSALLRSRELEQKHGKLLCFNGEPSRLQTRKAQYHWGWDWGPVLMDCGPYKPVFLQSFDGVIRDVFVKVDVNEALGVSSEVQVETSTQQGTIEVQLVSPEGEIAQTKKLEFSGGNASIPFNIPNAELWYPVSHGKPALYTYTVRLFESGTVVHAVSKTIGHRRVELVQEPFKDQEGTSFYFRVNNIPIYAAGSNWIPAHSMQTLLKDEDYSKWLQLAVDGNQNMVRVWGGGFYEEDIFYSECDRLGLLVWQDFMFACGQYPGYESFVENVRLEAVHQVKRLRNHACLAIYAGNNEDYQVAEQLHLDWDPDNTSGDYSKTSFPARTIYENTLPGVVSEFCSHVPYHPGSPWGGKNTADATVGDIHQWNVWHGSQEKYQDWYKLGGRFISEFGMEALPDIRTYNALITKKTEFYPQSEYVDHHNKADGFERRLALYVFENIKVEGLDMDSWIYATQLMQSECLAYAYRCWRRDWKGDGQRYGGGALVWQLNDCWPVASWSIVDFYRRPKLAYYAVKRESGRLGVGMYRNDDFLVDIWGVNATTESKEAVLKVDIYHVTTGKLLELLAEKKVVLAANASTEFVTKQAISSTEPIVIRSRFIDDKGTVFASAADWPQPLKYLHFPDREVKVTVSKGSVNLTANRPVKGVEIMVEKEVFLEDNGFDLFPGDDKVVKVEGLSSGDAVSVRYYQQEKPKKGLFGSLW